MGAAGAMVAAAAEPAEVAAGMVETVGMAVVPEAVAGMVETVGMAALAEVAAGMVDPALVESE